MGEEWNNANVKIKELYEKKWKVQAETHGKQLEKWSLKMQEEGRNEEIALVQLKVNKARAQDCQFQVNNCFEHTYH